MACCHRDWEIEAEMSAINSLRAHPWRWIAAALVALLSIAILAGGLIVRSLLQPQRFTALLQDQLAGAGLVLSVDKPAAPTLWPHPAVQLEGFRLGNIGASAPLLAASEARIVVPWRALLHREIVIERLEIETPRIDLDQLQALLARLPQTAGAPWLPRIGAGLKLVNGILVRGDAPLLIDIDAATGPLLAGTPFRLDVSARDSANHGGALALRTTPVRDADALRFEHAGLGVDIERGPRAQLSGDAAWRGGAAITASFRGTLTTPVPGSSGPSPAARSNAKAGQAKTIASEPMRSYTLELGVTPAQAGNPVTITVKLDGADEHIDAQTSPPALIDWWRQLATAAPNTPIEPPPLRGSAQIGRLDFDALHLQGVRIDSGPQVAPSEATPPANAKTAGKQR